MSNCVATIQTKDTVTRIDELDWLEKKPIKGWIKGLKFPILLHRQIFTNKDGSTGILYLISNDLDLTVFIYLIL